MGIVGVPSGLRFELTWSTPNPSGSAADATRGQLALWLGRHLVWGEQIGKRTFGLPWTWIDLLEHLARRWNAIIWEELDPLGLGEVPWRIRAHVQRRWRAIDSVAREHEQRSLLRFEDSHDLGSALGGATPPSLWLLREGLRVGLSSGQRSIWRPVPEVTSTLSALGDAIAARIRTSSDERAVIARDLWLQRARMDDAHVVALSTALPISVIQHVAGESEIRDAWDFKPGSNTPSELMVAARMLSPSAPPTTMTDVIAWLRERSHRPTPNLDALSSEALTYVSSGSRARPHVVGIKLAEWMRSIPGVATDERVDPERLLENWGVEISEKDLKFDAIDAVCCWGPSKGPAILVNKHGTHTQREAGRRATLAHELCHLLIDRHRSLPVAEVLGGRCPLAAEQRANAFAAELLMPRQIAGEVMASKGDPKEHAMSLNKSFGASFEMIAWQAKRSSYPLSKPVLMYLSGRLHDAHDRERFLNS